MERREVARRFLRAVAGRVWFKTESKIETQAQDSSSQQADEADRGGSKEKRVAVRNQAGGFEAMKRETSKAVLLFPKHMSELGIFLRREYRFHPERQWRFDFILDCGKSTILGGREFKLAFEIEGAIWSQGRHTRGKGYQEDLWKYAHATIDGWQIFRFSTEDVLNGTAKEFVRRWVDRAIATWKRG